MLTDVSALQLALDLGGVFVFALSGAVVAVRNGLDLFGILVLAWTSGLGGGLVRDVFLGITPPVGVRDVRLLGAALAAGLLVFLLIGPWRALAARHPGAPWARVSSGVKVLDAAGLALFAVSGALVALDAHAGPVASVLIGGITAVGGGVLRDVLVRRIPEVLHRELYALPALAGAGLVVLFDHWGMLSPATAWVAVVLILLTRLAAVALDLNAPRAISAGGADAESDPDGASS